MVTPELAIRSNRILTPDGFRDGILLIGSGRILDIIDDEIKNFGFPVDDAKDWVVMPGLIDSHVHINEPGRTNWEGFETATRAAAAGGITTLIEMPLNANPVTTSVDAFQEKIVAAEGKLYVNCGFWGGFIPESYQQLEELLKCGVFGIKVFLVHSGIDEFPNVSAEDLIKVMPVIARYQLPLLVHAEIDIKEAEGRWLAENPHSYAAYLKSRPKSREDMAIALMIDLCDQFGGPVHIVHLSAASSLPQLKAARAKGLPVTVETCPHFLVLNAEEIPDSAPVFKCAPPIRERENNLQLWDGLREGVIDFIVTDHSPATPDMKQLEQGNYLSAWGGIASLQFSLPLMWTAAAQKGFNLETVLHWMSTRVAEFIGLDHKKGKIEPGYDADLVIWDPDESFTVKPESIYFRHKITPYIGHQLRGVVKKTFVGGNKVYDQGDFISLPTGQLLFR